MAADPADTELVLQSLNKDVVFDCVESRRYVEANHGDDRPMVDVTEQVVQNLVQRRFGRMALTVGRL